MKLYPIETGNFKLDGGAMFGVVPKVLWSKVYPADENNLCNWSMRCLLVVDGDRKILIDDGIGNKQDEKWLRHYHLNGDDTGIDAVAEIRAEFSDPIPAIIITSDRDSGLVEILKSKELPLIYKPVVAARLHALIRHLI